MGYLYDAKDRLVCDFCGQSGGVRKRRCPYDYCPAPAACADCYAKHRPIFLAAAHQQCKQRAEEYRAQRELARKLMAQGKPVRCSAVGQGNYVRVTFTYDERNSRTEVYHMAPETYDAIPLATVATPDDYRAHGTLTHVATRKGGV